MIKIKGYKMKSVYLLLGLPGAGKSTFAKKHLKNSVVIELDAVRQRLADENVIGKKYSSDDNKIVFNEFYKEILSKASNFDSVVVDSTNAKIEEREAIYNLLKDFKPKFVVVKFTDSKEVVLPRIIKRQSQNKNLVHYFENPEKALEIYEKRIQESHLSLKEPIAEIWEVKNGNIINKQQKILIASTNLGKIDIYNQVCKELDLYTTSLAEIKVSQKVDETADNELGNAIIKAESYHNITGLPVIANDSGLVIDKFAPEDQPGVFVRRYTGQELTDQEMLNIYIEKLNKVGGFSAGHYNVALALIDFNGNLKTKLFKPKRYFINTPSKIVKKGVPLSSLSYDEQTKKYLSEMTAKERNDYEAEEMKKQKQFIKDTFCKELTQDCNII